MLIEDKFIARYKKIKDLHEGRRAVQNNDGMWGYLDENWNEVIPFEYTYADDFHEGKAVVSKTQIRPSGRYYPYGYINRENEVVIPYKYKEAHHFSEGLAAVKEDFFFGFINESDKYEIEPQFCRTRDFHDGYVVIIGLNNQQFHVDRKGNHFPVHRRVHDFVNGRAIIKDENEIYLVNTNYEKVAELNKNIDCKEIYDESCGYFLFKDYENKFGFLNQELKLASLPIFTKARSFKENISFVELPGNVSALLNTNFKIKRLKRKYTEVRDFSNGRAAVKMTHPNDNSIYANKSFWCYIDTDANESAEKYLEALDFENNKAYVQLFLTGDTFIIDEKYHLLSSIEPVFVSTIDTHYGKLTLKSESYYGMQAKKYQLLEEFAQFFEEYKNGEYREDYNQPQLVPKRKKLEYKKEDDENIK